MDIASACLYTYIAIVTSVYDGDTVTVDIDLGLHTWVRGENVRLARINAPEVKGVEREQGLVSRDWLRERLQGQTVVLKTQKDKTGKYGRYLVEIYQDGQNINDALVAAGMAEYRDY